MTTPAETGTVPDEDHHASAEGDAVLSLEGARVLGQLNARLFGAEPAVQIDRFVLVRRLGAGGMGEVMLAYDPELDRKVAIKLVRPDLAAATIGPAHDAGLLREARAAARLQHPNVVSIFEIGRAGDRLFIAMEYVAGRTLRAWLTEKPRTVNEILRAFDQAGRGLQAAHDAGLVHRDFKPDNLLVGDDDRVRVVDFGIASICDATPAIPADPVGEATTRRAVGTPRYMAPEQFEVRKIDARADQFAFCVSVWEALCGATPFSASSPAGLVSKVIEGRIDPPSGRMPRPVARILMRGLRPDPNDRYPDMRALLDALARVRAAPRRRAAVLGIAGALTVGGTAVWTFAPKPAECDEPTADALAGDDAARERLTAAIDHASDSRGNGNRALAVLDVFGDQWRNTYDEACAATHRRGEHSTLVLDARMACLERLRARARTLVDLLSVTDRAGAWRAIDALAELPMPARCLLVEAEDAAPPACAKDVDDRLDRAASLREIGKLSEALTHAHDAEAAARDCGPASRLAGARGLVAIIAADLDEDGSDDRLRRAATAAITDDAPEAIALAATRLAELEGAERGRDRDASVWIDIAAAAAARTGDDVLATDVSAVQARVALQAGDVDRAASLVATVLAQREAQFGDDHPRVATALALAAWVEQYREHWDDAYALHERSVAIRNRWYPPEHPIFATSLNAMAVIEVQRGNREQAEATYRRSIALLERALGAQHRDVGAPLINLADLLAQGGRTDAALELLARVERIARADGNDRLLEAGDVIRGIAYAEAGRLQEAEVAWRNVLELRTVRYGANDPSTSMAHNGVCRVLVMREHFVDALAHCRRAIAIDEVTYGPMHVELVGTLALLADAAEGARQAAEARTALERAVSIAETHGFAPARVASLRERIAAVAAPTSG